MAAAAEPHRDAALLRCLTEHGVVRLRDDDESNKGKWIPNYPADGSRIRVDPFGAAQYLSADHRGVRLPEGQPAATVLMACRGLLDWYRRDEERDSVREVIKRLLPGEMDPAGNGVVLVFVDESGGNAPTWRVSLGTRARDGWPLTAVPGAWERAHALAFDGAFLDHCFFTHDGSALPPRENLQRIVRPGGFLVDYNHFRFQYPAPDFLWMGQSDYSRPLAGVYDDRISEWRVRTAKLRGAAAGMKRKAGDAPAG